MLSSGLRSWQQENKYRVSDDTVYGVYENIGFSVTEEDGGCLFVFMLSGKDEAFDSLEDLLCNQSGELRNAQVGDVESYLALFFDEADGRLSSSAMNDVLDYVAGNFRSCGFRTPNICVKCGAPATKRSFYNDMVQPLCAPCREADKLEKAHKAAAPAVSDRSDSYERPTAAYYDPYEEREERSASRGHDGYDDRRSDRYDDYSSDRRDNWDGEEEGFGGQGSAPAGFFGALLGALAGLVPYIISSMLGFELAAFCFVSGIFAVLGYTAFGGLKSKSHALINVIALSEVLSLLMVLLVAGASNLSEGFSVMFKNLFELAGLNLIMAAVGALLGVMVNLDTLHKYMVSGKGTDSRRGADRF